MSFGIDLGTTNTAVSTMVGDEPQALKFGDAQQQSEYVPSVVAFKMGPQPKTAHGVAAKALVGDPDWEVYQNFKMLLGEPEAVVADHWPHLPEPPDAIVRHFIAALIGQIDRERQRKPRRIVVTVPEVWQLQNLQTKREQLIAGFRHQGIRQVEVRSEPVAAATYYLHCFRRNHHQPFQGHLLVCDCGGGTLDFCLVQVEAIDQGRPRMTVLERAGNGMMADGQIGSAGVAYDQAVVDHLFPGLRDSDPARFFRRVHELERQKIALTAQLTDELSLFHQAPDALEGDALFRLADGEVEVQAGHLVQVFDQIIKPDIEAAISALKPRLEHHRVELANSERFRVLMVGGFSSFYLIQHAIKAAFGNVASKDKRFEDVLTLPDRALAIAKGAALIANDLAEIIEVCPANIGVKCFEQRSDGELKARWYPILHKAQRIGDYHSPQWSADPFTIVSADSLLEIFVESIPGRPIPLKLTGETLSAFLPEGFVPEESKIEVGFSVDENMIFSVHMRPVRDHRRVRSKTLGNLMAQMPGLLTEGGKRR